MNRFIVCFCLCIGYTILAQSNAEIALSNAKKAIKLMDEGKINESIVMLQESEKLDPENYIYPYEIAYAKILQDKHEEAIDILERIETYDSINSQVYQALGNSYSYLGNPDKALEKYDEGLNKFPNAGNLHLEKGNIYSQQKKYSEAIKNYKTGITVDPMFPSNYYQLASLYLNSNDKLSGLIYGEIFMNIERTTSRTQEVSEWLFHTYKESIKFKENSSEVNFCDIVIDGDQVLKGNLEAPFCMVFEKNVLLSLIGKEKVDLTSLSQIRIDFLNNYFNEDYKTHPNVLFSYHKELMDNGLFNAYNHYIFQIAVPNQFDTWLNSHKTEFDDFVDWYTQAENSLKISKNNLFIK
ncbi:tetratricopeptide repeat protein [Marixanthomonas sp. SCSIO 43207]|uniref:tetratricopeptide repeat protein n=1 Tax=Marixanthomonas sp. SCSIO 43207 TaxID=2779360 RepID=UPI001CA99BE1|nr:tetratricopeptide repeat protein [Marixanthomonas sp. SCSIO 43207]UAB80824.1 tetratricopeptide repeat protein [Marixanthomonas sp. SCSIO 43207]